MAANKIHKPLVHTEATKQLLREKAKQRWANKELRAKFVSALSTRVNPWNDPIAGPIMREAASVRLKNRMRSPEMKANAAARISEFNKTPVARELRSANSSANWKNPEVRERMISGMVVTKASALKSTPPNEFESRCYAFLDECGVEYERQHPVVEAYTIPDAYIAERKMCIYFDSEYWHSMPYNKERDNRQRSTLESLGYAVMVIRCDRHAKHINQHDLEVLRAVLCA